MEFQTIIGRKFPELVIPLIEQSKKTIDVVVFDWRWYPQDPGASVQLFNQAIVRAVTRGVKVRAIANNDEIIRILKSCGVEAKRLKIKNLVHCKLMLIDQKIAVVGSHNYTQAAFTMNMELSVIIESIDELTGLCVFYNNLYSTYV